MHSIFPDIYKAYEFEKYLKSGLGRAVAIKRLYSLQDAAFYSFKKFSLPQLFYFSLKKFA